MTNQDRAALLASVLPLITDGAPMRGNLGHVNGWAWQSNSDAVKARLRFVATRYAEAWLSGTARVEEEEAVAFELDTMPLLTAVNAGTVRAAIKLAVSRLYDGPRGAPPARVIPQPKVALCGAPGCSELRTRDGLCETHRERERRAWAKNPQQHPSVLNADDIRAFERRFAAAVEPKARQEEEAVSREANETIKKMPAPAAPFVLGVDPGAPDYQAAVLVSSHPTGTVKYEAIRVNEHGQEVAVPIDPTVTTQPRPRCRTPGCKDRARDPGVRGNFWELDPWCYAHAREAADMGPASPLALRERLDREKAGIGFEPTVTNAVAKSRIAVGRVVMTSGRVGGPCDKAQVRMADGQLRIADVPFFLAAPGTGWTDKYVRVDMLTGSIMGLA